MKKNLIIFMNLLLIGFMMQTLSGQGMTIKVYSSDGTPVEGAMVSRYTSGWGGAIPTDNMGEAYFGGEGNFRFQVSYNHTSFTTEYISVTGEMDKSIFTTNVTIKGYDDLNNPVEGIGNQYYTGGYRTFGTTDSTGSVSKEMFPGTYNFTSNYNNTSNVQNITVIGNGYEAGKVMSFNTFLSRVTFKAVSYNNADVQGVGVTFYAGGWRNLPQTDVNGESTYLMYPGTYPRFKATVNSTSTPEFAVEIPGFGTDAGHHIEVPLNPVRVKFYNHETASNNVLVSYYAGGYRYISGEAYYMFPGIYKLAFRNGINRMVEIPANAPFNFEKVVSIIRLKDHAGDPLDIGSIRGGYGSQINYHVNSSTNSPSPESEESNSVWVDLSNVNSNQSRIFEVSKNSSNSTQTKDVYVNNIFDFQTNLMTLRLQTCDGIGIENGSVRYGMNGPNTHWGDKTDANGETSKEIFAGDMVVEMNINQSSEMRTVTLSGNDTFTWTTTLVKFHYPQTIRFGGANGTYAYFGGAGNTNAPTKQEEMLPGTVNFKFGNNPMVPITIPAHTEGCTFEGTGVNVRLIESDGVTGIPGGEFSYRYVGSGWISASGVTDADGNLFVIVPKENITPAMKHRGLNKQKETVHLPSAGYEIVFQTQKITLNLTDHFGDFIGEADSGSVSYYGTGWKLFNEGETDNGVATDELLSRANVPFSMRLNGARQEKNMDLSTDTEMDFLATKVIVSYKDEFCNPMVNKNISYRPVGSGWWSMGVTDSEGMTEGVYLLPSSTNTTFQETNVGSSSVNESILEQPEQIVELGDCNPNLITIRLIDSEGNPLQGGEAKYWTNPMTWTTIPELTDANGNTYLELLDGRTTLTTQMTYRGITVQLNDIDLESVNNVIVYQTKKITVTLADHDGNLLDSDTNTVVYNSYYDFGNPNTVSSGSVTDELLPGSSVAFAMKLNGTREQKNGINLKETDTIDFHATKVHVKYIDDSCQPAEGANITYYSSSYYPMGATDENGLTDFVYMLPGTGTVLFYETGTPTSGGIWEQILNQPEQEILLGDECLAEPECNWIVRVWGNNGEGASWELTNAANDTLLYEPGYTTSKYNDIRYITTSGPLKFHFNNENPQYRSVNINVINDINGKVAHSTIRNDDVVFENLSCVKEEAQRTNSLNALVDYNFNYYPNPVKDILHFNSMKTIENAQIFNVAGLRVLNTMNQAKGLEQINVADLPAGVYVVKIIFDDGMSESFKIVKK